MFFSNARSDADKTLYHVIPLVSIYNLLCRLYRSFQ